MNNAKIKVAITIIVPVNPHEKFLQDEECLLVLFFFYRK
jgi:hypothetical protein